MTQMRFFLRAACTLALGAAAGCGGAATGAPPVSTTNPTSPSFASLQFAVGTANLYGNPQPGLNVVSTYRKGDGTSADGVNTPSISGPFVVTALPTSSSGLSDPYTTAYTVNVNGTQAFSGPSIREAHGNTIFGTPQTVAPGTPPCDTPATLAGFITCPSGLAPNTSTFGESGGVFAMGLAPYNAVAETGQAYGYQPYPVPFYSTHDPTSTYQFVPWGGPPAFDPDGTGMGERDGAGAINGVDSMGFPYFLGVGEGITTFDGVTPTSGTYTLNVAISTVGNNGSVSTATVSKQATMNASRVLPALTTPVFTPDGHGGGSMNVTLPAGVTEAYVQIVDFGPQGGPGELSPQSNPSNCQGARGTSFAPVYYTLHVTSSGTVSLPDAIGPNLSTSGGAGSLQPSHSICTAADNSGAGDDIVVQLIGFDYPAYQPALGLTQASTPENPVIVGAAGQDDITISRAAEQDGGGTSQTPLLHQVRMRAANVHRIRR